MFQCRNFDADLDSFRLNVATFLDAEVVSYHSIWPVQGKPHGISGKRRVILPFWAAPRRSTLVAKVGISSTQLSLLNNSQ
jgi:hypothetical protein